MDRLLVQLGQAEEVGGAGVGAQEGAVAPPAGLVEAPEVLRGAHRDAPRALPPGVLALGVEEVLLGVLVGAQGDDVDHPRRGDLGDPGGGGLHGGQAEVVAQQRVGMLPGQAVAERLRIGPPPRGGIIPPQVADHLLHRLRAVEGALDPAQGAGPGDDGGCAPEAEALPRQPGLLHRLAEGVQEGLAVLRREAVAEGHQVGVGLLDGPDEGLRGDGWPQEDGAPALGLGEAEEVVDPGDVHTLPQGAPDDGGGAVAPGTPGGAPRHTGPEREAMAHSGAPFSARATLLELPDSWCVRRRGQEGEDSRGRPRREPCRARPGSPGCPAQAEQPRLEPEGAVPGRGRRDATARGRRPGPWPRACLFLLPTRLADGFGREELPYPASLPGPCGPGRGGRNSPPCVGPPLPHPAVEDSACAQCAQFRYYPLHGQTQGVCGAAEALATKR